MAAGFNNEANNCQVTEAIQLRERAVLVWDLVHDELSMQPFCPERQRFAHILVCIAYMHCCRGGCCCPCYEQEEIFHELTIHAPICDITLVKYCTDIWGEEDEKS